MNITAENIVAVLKSLTQVAREDGDAVTVLGAMNFHAGLRREKELADINPGSMTTKVYVMTLEKGPLVCNVSKNLHGEGLILTHLQEMVSVPVEGFFRQINREVDRTEEGEVFLRSAWSMV